MLLTIHKNTPDGALEQLAMKLKLQGVSLAYTDAGEHAYLTLLGNTSVLDVESFRAIPFVTDVRRLSAPYRLVSRTAHPADTVVTVGAAAIGRTFCLIAGPCAVESEVQINGIAAAAATCGAQLLRGGAFKPRTSPYTFQGLGKPGITLLRQAGIAAGLPVVSEITDPSQLPLFEDIDVLQVGARNMQNYELLRALSQCGKQVILKRGMSATLEELLLSAEYLLSGGNEQVILCERGIRTFAKETRATLDLSAVPVLKKMTHLPVIVDPSHAAGLREYVSPLALAAVAAGADGIMVEVHDRPATALSDGMQALTPDELAALSEKIQRILPIVRGK